MAFLFGGAKPVDPKQQMRQVDRGLKKSGRELEREIKKLQMDEKKTLAEIKKLASQGQQGAAKMMAKQVVMNRKQQEKLYKGRAQLNGVSNMAKSAQASQAMMKGMATATQAMSMANAQMNPAEMSRMAMEFERQSAQMEMSQEMMEEAMDSALAGSEEEEEADEVVDAVFEELNIDKFSGMSAVPTGPVESAAVAEEEDDEVDQMMARLAALKGSAA